LLWAAVEISKAANVGQNVKVGRDGLAVLSFQKE